MARQALFILMMVFLAGCSVAMALKGKDEPDLSFLEIGTTQEQIEFQLGPPIFTKAAEDDGSLNYYQYIAGDEPSPGRALAHGILDIATLMLWELYGVERNHGTKMVVEVEYDQNKYAVSIRKGTRAHVLPKEAEEQ